MKKSVSLLKKGLRGEITIPSDKSVSHRAIMFSSIAEGECVIKNFSEGKDCHSTLNLFKNLGVEITFLDNRTLKVISNGKLTPPSIDLDCGNSGTTVRLCSGILAGQNFNSKLIGDESLSKRPMKRVIEPLSLMGAEIISNYDKIPLTIKGHELHGIEYKSKIASAQVKSCILLAGLNAEGQTIFEEPYLSRNHTEKLFLYLDADIETKDNVVKINPSKLQAKDIEVVGDISSAAFFIVAALIVEDSDIIIRNVGLNPTRTGIIDVVKKMGGNIEILNPRLQSGEEVADLRVQYTENLKATSICGEDIPRLIDEIPIIVVLASQCEGSTVIKDAGDLRNKESDRISCLCDELKKIGFDIEELSDGLIINGKTKIKGGNELECYHDHRLAMSFYVAGLIAKNEILINGFEWTNISFPEFEKLFTQISL